jgi:hypothetical protein
VVFSMIIRESPSVIMVNMGRGAYDTTGVPKPKPPLGDLGLGLDQLAREPL